MRGFGSLRWDHTRGLLVFALRAFLPRHGGTALVDRGRALGVASRQPRNLIPATSRPFDAWERCGGVQGSGNVVSIPATGELGQSDEDVELQVLGEHRLEVAAVDELYAPMPVHKIDTRLSEPRRGD